MDPRPSELMLNIAALFVKIQPPSFFLPLPLPTGPCLLELALLRYNVLPPFPIFPFQMFSGCCYICMIVKQMLGESLRQEKGTLPRLKAAFPDRGPAPSFLGLTASGSLSQQAVVRGNNISSPSLSLSLSSFQIITLLLGKQ